MLIYDLRGERGGGGRGRGPSPGWGWDKLHQQHRGEMNDLLLSVIATCHFQEEGSVVINVREWGQEGDRKSEGLFMSLYHICRQAYVVQMSTKKNPFLNRIYILGHARNQVYYTIIRYRYLILTFYVFLQEFFFDHSRVLSLLSQVRGCGRWKSTAKFLWAAQTKKGTAYKLMELHVSPWNWM